MRSPSRCATSVAKRATRSGKPGSSGPAPWPAACTWSGQVLCTSVTIADMPASRIACKDVAVVREGFIAPGARLGLEPCPRKRKAEHRAAQAARELDVFGIAIPKIGRLAARNEPAHALPHVANVVVPVVGLALMVGGCDTELKVARHERHMRGFASPSL